MSDSVASDMAESLYLRFHLILFLGDKQVKSLHTKKIGRIHWLARNREFDRAQLKVTYGESGLDNEGEYTNADDLIKALQAFTEPELRDYLTNSQAMFA